MTKEPRICIWGKDNFFNKWYWEKWTTTCKRMKLYPCLTPYTKINAKWIEYINIRPETTKLLEKNTWGKPLGTDLGNYFLDLTPKAKITEAKINKWNYTKLKSFCTAKEIINKMKKHHMELEKIFANHLSDKELMSKIYKELIQINSKTK